VVNWKSRNRRRACKALAIFLWLALAVIANRVSYNDALAESSAGTNISVGIGAITDSFDGTSDSFSLVQYLKQNPITLPNVTIRLILIDHPKDADYSLNGNVKSSLGVARAAETSQYDYQWKSTANLTLWKQGSLAQAINADSEGSKQVAQPTDQPRSACLVDLWAKVRTQVADRIATDIQGDAK